MDIQNVTQHETAAKTLQKQWPIS